MNKTIEARELRIGNIISENTYNMGSGNFEGLPIVVNGNIIKTIELSPDLHGFSPIELTPEILEKIGKRSSVFGDTRTYWIIGDFLYCEDEPVLNKGLHWLQNFHYFKTGEELPLTL